jgi:hypothetical protein
MRKIKTYREELESESINKLSPKTTKAVDGLIKAGNFDAAIKMVLTASGLKNRLPTGFERYIVYEPKLAEKCRKRVGKSPEAADCDKVRGETGWLYRRGFGRDVVMRIGPKAFESVPILYSTIYHEYVHVKQYRSFGHGPRKGAKEVEAYFFELKRAGVTGIAKDIKEILGVFGNLRKYYRALKASEKTTYKKDYDWAREEVLRLVTKNLKSIADLKKLFVALAVAESFLKDVGSELKPKGKADLRALIRSRYKTLFLPEAARIRKLRTAPDSPLDWYTLKTCFQGLSDADKFTLAPRYEGALLMLFNRLVRSIMKLKPRPASEKRSLFVDPLRLPTLKRTLIELYGDLTKARKSKRPMAATVRARLKTRYVKALKRLNKVIAAH